MRAHEVPTHVQAEDRVLLWFTFPQVVAMVAVCALSYGAYRYAPVGPSEVRMAIAIVLGVAGIAVVVGKVGGRRLPLVAADLLKYRLGARRYTGPVSQLVRNESPAPAQPARTGPGPLRLMAKRAGRSLRRIRRMRKRRERAAGRTPFRPHRRFGKPRRSERDTGGINGNGNEGGGRKARRRRFPRHFLPVMAAVALAATVATIPQAALADGHEPWRDEIEFELAEPVEGRRIFVEGLTVSGSGATMTLRAAADIELRTRAYGGPEGTWLRFWSSASLSEGERVSYVLPLHGPAPSFTFAWEDGLGQAGAFTVEGEWLPHPLPQVEGGLCDLEVTSLGWTPGQVSGVIESACEASVEEPMELQTVAGFQSVIETALMDAAVTAVAGTVSVQAGGGSVSVPLVADGATRFRIPVGADAAIHAIAIRADITASLSIPMPPLATLTRRPERTEQVTRTVHLHRPGASDYAVETATVANEDGTTTSVTATAYAHVPSATIARDVTVDVQHPEQVSAKVVARSPVAKTRAESLSLSARIGSDDPFEVLAVPEPEPQAPPAEQTQGGDLSDWFDWLGWEWPW